MNYVASPAGGVHTPLHNPLLFTNQRRTNNTNSTRRSSPPRGRHTSSYSGGAPLPPPPHSPLFPSQSQHDEQLATMALYLKNYYGQDDDESAKGLSSISSDDVLALAQCFYLDLFRLLRDRQLFEEHGYKSSNNTFLYEPTPQHVGVPIHGASPSPPLQQPQNSVVHVPMVIAQPYYLPPPPMYTGIQSNEQSIRGEKQPMKKERSTSPKRSKRTSSSHLDSVKAHTNRHPVVNQSNAKEDSDSSDEEDDRSTELSIVSSKSSQSSIKEVIPSPPSEPRSSQRNTNFLKDKAPTSKGKRVVVRKLSPQLNERNARLQTAITPPVPTAPSAPGAKYSDPEWLKALRTSASNPNPPPPMAPPPTRQFANLTIDDVPDVNQQATQYRQTSVASTALPPRPSLHQRQVSGTPMRSGSVDSRASSPSTRVRTPPPTRKFVSGGIAAPPVPPPLPVNNPSQLPERYTSRLRTPSVSFSRIEAPLQPIRLETQLERDDSIAADTQPHSPPSVPPQHTPRVSASQPNTILSSPIQPLPFAATMPYLKQGDYFIKYASHGGKAQRRYLFVRDYMTAMRRVGGSTEVIGIISDKELASRAKGGGKYEGPNVTEGLMPYLCWTTSANVAADPKALPSERLCLLEMMDIIFGSNDNFTKKRNKRNDSESVIGLDGKEVPEEYCFSLIFPSRSVDVAALEESQLLTWAGGLLSVLKKNMEMKGQ